MFQRRIDAALRGAGLTAADLLESNDAELLEGLEFSANDLFDWTVGSVAPASVIAALPPLPDALQYRFVIDDLILLDVNANVILDVLPDVLAAGNVRRDVAGRLLVRHGVRTPTAPMTFSRRHISVESGS